MPDYQYHATINRWVDADTLDATVDLGFTVHVNVRFRLADIDAPERFTPEGEAATDYVNNQWPPGTPVIVESVKRGKYGRWIGRIHVGVLEDQYEVNAAIVAAGHASTYE